MGFIGPKGPKYEPQKMGSIFRNYSELSEENQKNDQKMDKSDQEIVLMGKKVTEDRLKQNQNLIKTSKMTQK